MIKTLEIQKAIMSKLSGMSAKSYEESAPPTAVFPYMVFNLPTSTDIGENQEYFILEVDIWNQDDTVELETTAEQMNKLLNKSRVSINGLGFYILLSNRVSLNDPDERIKRRKYTYQIRTFGGNQ